MINKLVRIGRDAELKFTQSGKAVIGLACVYDIGWGDKKKPQWIEVVIWEKKAESLAPYLLKGSQIVICADDVELETYQKNDGTQGSKLKCRAINIDLVGSKDQSSNGQVNQNYQPQAAPQQQAQSQHHHNQPPQPQGAAMQGYTSQAQQPAPPSDFNNSFDDDCAF